MSKRLAQALQKCETKAEQKKLAAGVGVYAYYFPEIRRTISHIAKKYPHDVFLHSIKPGLDDFHKPIIRNYIKRMKPLVSGLEGFEHQYPTAGSSEAIYHQLVKIKLTAPKAPIYVLSGDYQGYQEYAKALGMKITEVRKPSEAKKKGYWFISNPSARDGNVLPSGFVEKICEKGHRVILDLSYVGLTGRTKLDVSHKNIVAVLTSLSKPFGLFYYRVGFAFFREPIDSLWPNKWFKNIFSLIAANEIIRRFAPDVLVKKYRKWQEKIVEELKKRTGLPLVKSDIAILATLEKNAKLTSEQERLVAAYRRGEGYRFSLTPYFLQLEKAQEVNPYA